MRRAWPRWLRRRVRVAQARRIAADENDGEEMRVIREQMGELALPVARGGGVLQPGVELDESAGLLESMEAPDTPD